MRDYDTAVLGGYQRNYSDNERMPEKNAHKAAKYPLWLECYKVWLMFSFPLALLMFIAYFLGGSSMLYFPAVMLVFPIIATIARRVFKNLFLFLLAHIAMGAWFLLSPSVYLTVGGGIYLILLMVYGLVRQLSSEGEGDLGYTSLYVCIALMMVIYILAEYLGRTGFIKILVPMTIVYAALFFFYQHRTSVMDALKAMDRKSNFSVPQILRFNSGMFLIYLVIIAGIFATLYFVGLSDLLRKAGNLLIVLIKRLMRALLRVPPTEEAVQEEEHIIQEMTQDNPMSGLDSGVTSPFWIFMEKILVVVFIIAVVIFLGYLAVQLYKKFNASYKFQGAGYEETKTFYKEDKTEETVMPKLKWYDRSFENRIRRQYYRKVKGAVGKIVFSSDTPREVGEKLPAARDIIPDYTKVRYDPAFGKEDSGKGE